MAWKYRVLVVANVTATSDELLERLVARSAHNACSFSLLVPATGGGGAGRRAAAQKLTAALERLEAAGLEVDGRVGDADPVVAVHDVWDPMRWDEIVVSTLPTGASRWLQADLPHRIEKLTDLPVRHVVAQPPPKRPKPTPMPAHESYGILTPLAALGSRGARR